MDSDYHQLRGEGVEEVSGTRQLRALMYKSATIQKRQTKTLICQCFIPLIFIVILAVLQIEITKVLDENLPKPGTIQIKGSKYVPFSKHTPGSKWNSSYAVVYDDQNVTVGYLTEDRNGSGLLGNIPQYRTRYSDSHRNPHLIRPIFTYYSSPEELYDNYTLWKDEAIALGNTSTARCPDCPIACFYFNDVIIEQGVGSEAADLVLDYTVVLDTQLNAAVPANRSTAINMMNNAYLKDVYNEIFVPWFGSDFLSNDPFIATYTRPMPFVIGEFITDVASFFGIFLLPFCLTFLLPVFMYMVVMEKEEKLRSMMLMMGLRMRYYWIVTYLFNYVLYIIISLIVVIVSVLFNLRIFTQTEPSILFLSIFLWGFALNSLSIFLSAFFSSTRTATIVGYMLVIASVVVSNTINITTNYESLPNPIFLLYPPFAFFRIIFIIGLYCGVDQCPLWGYNSAHIGTLCFFLFLDAVLYLIAGLYLDAVLPSQWGVPRHPLFPFYALRDMIFGEQEVEVIGDGLQLIDTPPKSYEQGGPKNGLERDQVVLEEERVIRSLFEHADIVGAIDESEKARVMSALQRGLLVHNLKKTYDNGKEAVKGVSFAAPEGMCFGLLGPNGAGKTTTISMLTGLFPPSCGRARVGGFELDTELDKVHRVMGVCPQFDILWRALTVRETLLFYTRLKGIPTADENRSVEDSLESVGLTEFADRRVKELSGGMKRRVSLAVSLCGNARVVFLDEPTTGLDPVTRRDLWDTLLEMKKQNRCLILTTHSMEEADVLCDRIGIMTLGELSCLGTSLQLKNKYGSGYLFQVQHSIDHEAEARNFISHHFPSAVLRDYFPGHLIYSLGRDSFLVSQLFRIMNTEGREHGVVDWGLSQTSLEDVFLNVAETDTDTFED